MSLNFKVFVWSPEKRMSYEIDDKEFEKFVRANELLTFGLAFEQRFNIVLENFAELERFLLDAALRDAIFSDTTFSHLYGSHHTANRHLTNLMASSRLYLDQTGHALSSTFGRSEVEVSKFKRLRSEEYDSVLGYRVLEALRNYSQHRGLPAHSIKFSSSRDDAADAGSKIKHVVSILLAVEALAEDPKFKAEIIEDLRESANSNGYVELMPLTRDYMGCLGRVHEEARALVAESLTSSDELMKSNKDRIETKVGTRDVIVRVTKISKGSTLEELHISEELTKQRNEYESKTQYAKYIAKQYVAMC